MIAGLVLVVSVILAQTTPTPAPMSESDQIWWTVHNAQIKATNCVATASHKLEPSAEAADVVARGSVAMCATEIGQVSAVLWLEYQRGTDHPSLDQVEAQERRGQEDFAIAEVLKIRAARTR